MTTMEEWVEVYQNKDRIFVNGKGSGIFISYEINSTSKSIVKFDKRNDEENEFGYTIVPTDSIKLEDDVYKYYKLVSIFDIQSQEQVAINDMLGKWFPIRNKDLKIGSALKFKMVDDPFGYRNVGNIVEVEHKIIRKRNHLFVSTGEQIYQILERKV